MERKQGGFLGQRLSNKFHKSFDLLSCNLHNIGVYYECGCLLLVESVYLLLANKLFILSFEGDAWDIVTVPLELWMFERPGEL